MIGHWKFFIKGIVLGCILALMLSGINDILLYKSFYNSTWPTTSTFHGFYDMEEGSIDVLFLGSSHCVSAFSPQEIYDVYGLRTYNLGCEQQNLLVSYFWLKEALRTQSPKAVVLETYLCFDYRRDEPLNSAEAMTRKAIDPMEWSAVKREAVQEICRYDEEQTVSSYYLPNIRFHSRWDSLGEDDMTYLEMDGHHEMKGFSPLSGRYGDEQYEPFEAGCSTDREEMHPLMAVYLDKIVELCEQKDIVLILVKTPTIMTSIARYNTMCDYALEHQIGYYDLNERVLYDEAGCELAEDSHEGGHMNYKGARKVSRVIASILIDTYDIQPVWDLQWEESRGFYQDRITGAGLRYITDIYMYLEALDKEHYAIFMAVRDDASVSFDQAIFERMEGLGLTTDMRERFRSSYCAVILPEGVEERESMERITLKGTFRKGRSQYIVSSAGYTGGDSCSIMIDGMEYAPNKRGLNIVVYDTICKKVIDAVCFDTHDPLLSATR